MRTRLVAALGVAAACALSLTPARAAGLPIVGPTPSPGTSAPTPSLCTPVVSGVTSPDANHQPQHFAPQGATVTVSGANFAQPACTLDGVKVGPVSVPASAVTVAPGGTSLTFALPASASGPVSVSATDVLGNVGTSNANFDFILTPTAVAQAPSPVEGSLEPVTGSGYTPFLPAKSGGIAGAGVIGWYQTCDAPNQTFPAVVSSDISISLPAPNAYCFGQLVMLYYAPYDTTKPIDCTDAATAPQYNCILVGVPAGLIDVYFYVAAVNPPPFSTVPIGNTITITGNGFGTSGTADVSGVPARVRWSDTTIAVTVPPGALTGELTVQRGSGDQQALQIGTYFISKPGTPVIIGPGNGGGILGPHPGVGGVHVGHPGVAAPSSHAAAQQKLTLAVAKPSAAPGDDVGFTVTLTANGKPVSGAPVTMTLVSTPGKDAAVKPLAGRTDTAGRFSGVLHLSKKAGAHLLLARSGIYSDEVTVVASLAQQGLGGINLPFGLGPLNIRVTGNPVVVWLSVATGLLLIFGIVVNINVLRRFIWSITARPLIRRARGARPA